MALQNGLERKVLFVIDVGQPKARDQSETSSDV